MDQGIIGSVFTVFVFVIFVGVVFWTFSGKNKAKFDEAANLVFDDEKNDHPQNKDRES